MWVNMSFFPQITADTDIPHIYTASATNQLVSSLISQLADLQKKKKKISLSLKLNIYDLWSLENKHLKLIWRFDISTTTLGLTSQSDQRSVNSERCTEVHDLRIHIAANSTSLSALDHQSQRGNDLDVCDTEHLSISSVKHLINTS